jgi:hypothetical protein
MQTELKCRVVSLDQESAMAGHTRKQSLIGSKMETLRRPLLLWFQHHELRSVLLELCSCYCRIQLGSKMQWDTSALDLAQVLASLPKMTFPHSCSGNLAYSMCIRALEMDRPYLTAFDYGLFAQAWFQAEKFFRGKVDNQLYAWESDSKLRLRRCNARRPGAVQQCSKRSRLSPLPSRESKAKSEQSRRRDAGGSRRLEGKVGQGEGRRKGTRAGAEMTAAPGLVLRRARAHCSQTVLISQSW